MAIVLKDRVKQTAAAPGTGTITLGATATGFQAFSAIGNGNVTYFAIVDPTSGAWEVNYGTYTSSGTTLSRNATPLSSSAAGALVNFTGTVDVFCTYPSEKAIYEEVAGNVLVDGGPITVVGTGVTSYTSFSAALGEFYANVNSFAQIYAQNLSGGATASTDIVAYNDLGDGTYNFVDMGISSSNYSDATYPIFTAGSAYVYNDGGEMIIGSSSDDLLLFAGGVATTNWALRVDKTTQAITTKAGVAVGGAFSSTGAASFSSTVALSANPTTALQAATKQYVDEQVTAGIHIHEPVRVETTGNLTATYTGGGTNANIILIANGTDITFFGVTPSVGDQFYIGSSSNGLLANTAYFVVNIITAGTVQASLTYGGSVVTGLTNGAPTIPSVINSGIGATLTNAGAQAALQVDGVNLSTTNRVMVRLQTNGAENGVYTVTTVGSGSTNWVLTRATDASFVSPSDPNGLGTGDYFFTQEGVINAGDSHVLTTEPNTMIIGYTPLTYTQFSGSVDYVGGTNISIVGQTISVTGAIAATNGGTGTATVTTGDLLYGSATDTWSKLAKGAAYKSLVMNGAATLPEWNAVALNQSGAVSGALPATNGGTGLNSYTLGDTIYSSAANTLLALPGNTTTTKKFLVQTGTGSVSAAPAWGTINGSDVTGNISGSAGSVANALTAGTYLTSAGTFDGSAARTFAVDATSANTVSKVVARDSSGNFSAGTITAALTGNASTATAATNISAGAANQIPYQTGAATTSFITAPTTAGTYLGWNGSAFAYSAISVPNALTMNSSGIGDVSGTTFNGSTARTISYNTVGASPLAGSTSLTTTGTVTTGTWSGLFGAVTGANLTNLTAGNLAGTIPSAVLGNSTAYVGTTAVALNRSSANQALTGILSATMPGATSGSVQVIPAAVAGTGTVLTLPATTGTAITTGDTGTVTNTMLAGSIADTKLSTISTAGKVSNSATTATNANTASAIVARDASGNFSAGTITAALTGNASTATSATSATTATNVAGGVAGAVHYQSAVGTTGFSAAGTSGQVLTSTGTTAPGWTTATSANTASAIVQRDASGNFTAGTITAALSGNASTATSATSATSATTATTATNLAGGSAGTIPYQSAAGTTVQLTAGTSGYILQANGAAAPSWVVASTAAGVNNGTLTMNVSGTGLSGSQTFTANQSSAATFTVTSNATNANTASTIVARDASGNFSAGTITATLSGNATSATTATSATSATLAANTSSISSAVSGAYTWTGIQYLTSTSNTAASTNDAKLQVYALAGGGAVMSFHRPSAYAVNMGLDSDNVFRIGGWSAPANLFQMTMAGALTMASSVTATSFSGAGTGLTGTATSLSIGGNAATATTAANVNNGTLTMNVSGTGLSGSQTFTANQSSAATFTVTSNATNANTASTIVARDASGNFSAGTITATLSGNATTATSATSATSATTATTATTANALNTANNYQVNSLGVGTAGSGTAGEIRATNNVTAYYSSDIKFKENVRNIPNAAATATAIGGKLFDWRDSYIEEHGGEDGYFVQKHDFGVIAQDVLAKFPVAVRTRPDGSLAVDYEKLSALALAAIAEQEDRIAKLEALVAKFIEGQS